jgi:hypothetical protein
MKKLGTESESSFFGIILNNLEGNSEIIIKLGVKVLVLMLS